MIYSKPLSTSFNISLKMQNSKRRNVQVVYFSTKGVSQAFFSNPFDMVMQHDLLLKWPMQNRNYIYPHLHTIKMYDHTISNCRFNCTSVDLFHVSQTFYGHLPNSFEFLFGFKNGFIFMFCKERYAWDDRFRWSVIIF